MMGDYSERSLLASWFHAAIASLAFAKIPSHRLVFQATQAVLAHRTEGPWRAPSLFEASTSSGKLSQKGQRAISSGGRGCSG